LVKGDHTSAQAALDTALSLADVKYAFVLGPDGQVLAHTFVPEFPDTLRDLTHKWKDGSPITLRGEWQDTVVFQEPVLNGVVGTVYVGFTRVSLISSIRTMERVILLNSGVVSLVFLIGVAVTVSRWMNL